MNKKTLYHKAKGGELRVWSVWSEEDRIYTEYGVLNGELQTSSKKATPKNVGKKNETTPEQQADLEAEALYKFKLDRKYSTSPEEAKEPLILPMLAKEIQEKYVEYPAFIQPKLDGCRCLAFWEGDRVKLISRSGKEWTVPYHINEYMEKILPKDCMVDGELYVHGQTFQTITSWIKKLRPETKKVQYHIYDMPIVFGQYNYMFTDRLECLRTQVYRPEHFDIIGLECDETPIVLTLTQGVGSPDQIKKFELQMLSEGYEGAIVRNTDGLYTFGYRSSDLLKVKTFKDSEFEVVDCIDGIGKFEGHAIFICKNDISDALFECTIACPMKLRADMYANREEYIGKKLTVKYFERTDDGLPRFPVGKAFRSEEDLPE